MKQNIIVILLTLSLLVGCSNPTGSSETQTITPSTATEPAENEISLVGITIISTGNSVIDEINFARKAIALGGEPAKRYYDEVIVPNVMSNLDMPQRLAEVKQIFYQQSALNSSISQADLRTVLEVVEDPLISNDIDNYTVTIHDVSLWKQGENSEIAWFSDLSKYGATADKRARASVAGWLADSGNSPNFGHRVAILNPAFISAGATSDVTNSMGGEPNKKSGGHVVARFRFK